MAQRCIACQAQLAESVKFCTNCGSRDLVSSVVAGTGFAAAQPAAPTPAPSVAQPTAPAAAASSSSSSFTAALPAGRALAPNTARIPMDAHEFSDFLGSLSRGLMRDKDQITKIRAAASAHHFTCAQAIEVAGVTKGHPGEAVTALYPALVDADANFASVLAALKWIEERQEVVQALKLDPAKYAAVLKK